MPILLQVNFNVYTLLLVIINLSAFNILEGIVKIHFNDRQQRINYAAIDTKQILELDSN